MIKWIASSAHASSQSDVSPGNCCKIARIDRISSLFNDDGDIVNSGEVGDVVTSRRLPTITKVILYFTLFGCKK